MYNSHVRRPRTRGFTLIELLIVVGIIAILAAIAIPNMLEAQIRAKVSRAKSDMRTLATALESYRVDSNNYPAENYTSPELITALGKQFLPNSVKLRPLTTPVAFITSLPVDVFDPGNDPLNLVGTHTYHYTSVNDPMYDSTERIFFRGGNPEGRHMQWMMQSYGPDRGQDGPESDTYWQYPEYDPTNGTVSIGNILRSGP